MKRADNVFPLPYFEIDANWNIREYSAEAEELFGLPFHFSDIVDMETKEKAKEWLHPKHEKAKLEMNLWKKDGDVLLADTYITWKNDLFAEVLLVPKDTQVDKVATRLQAIQTELTKTKLELVEEKERAEAVTEHNNRLSAPFISLTEESALVPLFGDLSHRKIRSIEQHLLEDVRDSEADLILFDFTAVGNIEKEGFELLAGLMKALSHMGLEITVIGLHPRHVPHVYKWALPTGVRFMQSLEQVLRSSLKDEK
ncbi:STAS domain-containing protein [Salimicrobium sp. PL1-032A]|uniref:STAS domain-containing protein n=1 Tax=Salimicrobium sp. PL1-032A TaxID=3095364 RepID=UPI0032600D1C